MYFTSALCLACTPQSYCQRKWCSLFLVSVCRPGGGGRSFFSTVPRAPGGLFSWLFPLILLFLSQQGDFSENERPCGMTGENQEGHTWKRKLRQLKMPLKWQLHNWYRCHLKKKEFQGKQLRDWGSSRVPDLRQLLYLPDSCCLVCCCDSLILQSGSSLPDLVIPSFLCSIVKMVSVSWVWWHESVISAFWEAEERGLFSSPVWAT